MADPLAQALQNYDPNQPTLKPYDPTWRDRIAAALMGDGRPSAIQRGFVSGLVGSTGTGSTGPSVADFVPGLGQALGAQDAASQGNYKGAALAAMPIPGASGVAPIAAKDLAQAAKNYGGGHAIAANVLLRQGPEELGAQYGYMGKRYPAQVQKTVAAMDQMAQPLAEDTTLYRAMPIDANAKPGDVVHDPGFMSTATSSGTPTYLAQDRGQHLVTITAQQGSNAIDLNKTWGAGERNEVVLPRGSRLQLTSVDHVNNRAQATLLPLEGP